MATALTSAAIKVATLCFINYDSQVCMVSTGSVQLVVKNALSSQLRTEQSQHHHY